MKILSYFSIVIFFTAIVLFVFGCGVKNQSVQTEQDTDMQVEMDNTVEDLFNNLDDEDVVVPDTGDFVMASINRTVCFGHCPVYIFTIYQNGFCTYFGQNNVKLIGHYEGIAISSILDSIKLKAVEIGYFEFNDEYDDKHVTDLPATNTTVAFDGKTKSIRDRYNTPENLRNFEKYLDTFIEEISWTKVVTNK